MTLRHRSGFEAILIVCFAGDSVAVYACSCSAMVAAWERGLGVDVVVRVEGPGAADELRSLRTWLIDDDDFRGRRRPAVGTRSRRVPGLVIR